MPKMPVMKTVSTPWGPAEVADELKLAQRAGERRFGTLLQLLEGRGGERLLRIAYTTDGVVRRGPVTLRERDLARLRAELDGHPALAEALAQEGGA
jgi:hypothetical protein